MGEHLGKLSKGGAEKQGGIVRVLDQGSVIERCFVTGTYSGTDFSAIAVKCNASTIRQCGVGRLEKPSSGVGLSRLMEVTENATLENNACIDSNYYRDKANEAQCRTVAAALFKQRYFEHTLHWDFDTVWEWDAKKDRPALRRGASVQLASPAVPNGKMMDLLTQQIRANIWL